MRMLKRILDGRPGVGGQLGYFGLAGWWQDAFSAAERQRMEAAFNGAADNGGNRMLARGEKQSPFGSAAALLAALTESLSNRPEDRHLACRVLGKAEERARAEQDVLGLFSAYHQAIRLHCKWKEEFADSVDLAFAACHKQIRLAPEAAEALRRRSPGAALPTHLGYLQAANMLEQQGAYLRAIEVCRQAEAEGWSGNWAWRVQRMAKKAGSDVYGVRSISSSGMGPV